MQYSGYMLDRKGAQVVVGSGILDPARKRTIDGQAYVAVVGPRGGLRGWVLALHAPAPSSLLK